MAWSAPSHYLNQCWNIVNSNLRNKLQWNARRNSFIFILENAFRNGVCEMASIWSRPQWVIPCLADHSKAVKHHIMHKYFCNHWSSNKLPQISSQEKYTPRKPFNILDQSQLDPINQALYSSDILMNYQEHNSVWSEQPCCSGTCGIVAQKDH